MIIINIILAVAQLAGGVVSAYYAAEWRVGNIVGNSLASTAVSVYYIDDLYQIYCNAGLSLRVVAFHKI